MSDGAPGTAPVVDQRTAPRGVLPRRTELSPRTFCTFRREFSSLSRRFLGGGAPAMTSRG